MDFHALHLAVIRQQLPYWAEISKEQELMCNKGRPLCVVFDLDEVLISPLHHNFYGENFSVGDYFNLLEDINMCPSYPGAREVVQTCRELNLNVFFVTARSEISRDHTSKNLLELGLIPDRLIMKDAPDDLSSQWKTFIRQNLSSQYRIVANIGDQVSDLGEHVDINYLIPHHFYNTR